MIKWSFFYSLHDKRVQIRTWTALGYCADAIKKYTTMNGSIFPIHFSIVMRGEASLCWNVVNRGHETELLTQFKYVFHVRHTNMSYSYYN